MTVDHRKAMWIAQEWAKNHSKRWYGLPDSEAHMVIAAYFDLIGKLSRERLAKVLMDPHGKYPLEAMMAHDNWDNCLRDADAIRREIGLGDGT